MRVKDRSSRTLLMVSICVLTLSVVQIPPVFSDEEILLDIAIQTALADNLQLKAIREKINVAQFRLDGIALIGNPALETEIVGSGGEWSLELAKSFQLGGQQGHQKRIAETNIAKVNAEIAEAEWSFTKSVKITFYNLILAQEKLKLIEEIVQLNEQVTEIAQFQFDAGEVSVTQVNLAKIHLQSVLREEAVLESERQLAQLELNSLMGVPLEKSIVAVGELKCPPQTLNLDTLSINALAHRDDLKSLRLDEQLTESELGLAKAANIPNLSVAAIARREAGENLFGGLISIPLPLFDRNRAGINASKAQQQVLAAEIRNQERQITYEVTTASLSLLAAQKTLNFYEDDLLNLLDENLELTRTAYELGEAELLEVILTQNEFIEIRFAYLDALAAHHKALTALQATVGVSRIEN